jgi:hypothetical protein
MGIDNEEIMKRCDVKGCNYTQIFTSGTDFPAECWLVCAKCLDNVVDERKDRKDGCNRAISP